MTSLWPWLAIAGVGALHGLNPASGWMAAAAWGVRAHDRAQALKALLPIAAGHAAAIALVAGAVMLGLALERATLAGVAGGGMLVLAALHLWGRTHERLRAPAGHAGLALGSFAMATAHGAGLMLVPALMPICASAGPARAAGASGSLTLALAAVAVHTVAMLAITGAVAVGACRGWSASAHWLRRFRPASSTSCAPSAPTRAHGNVRSGR
ncbi:MAG: hypothetical protein ABJD97_01530 [Betaproteobacteria bacterium]